MFLFAVVLAPFLLACLVPWLKRVVGPKIGLAVAPLPILLFLGLVSLIPEVSGGKVLTAAWNWVPSLNIGFNLRLDGWSLLFTLLVTGIGSLVLLYSHSYLNAKEDLTKFYLYILAFMGSMLGVVLADNLILLYVFWELTSFTSFLLIGFWSHRERSVYGAQKALLITVFGGFAMLSGFVLIYLVTGSFNLATVLASKDQIMASPFFPWITGLILIGAFTKSAQVPFHIWLPNAMEAPTPVSAFLHSATMVKAGLYLVGRILPLCGGTSLWFYTVTGVGALTLLTGALLAVKQDDLKAILAYSTISQLGLIMLLFGIGTPLAVAAAAFHIFNHAAFKGALFLVVGIIDHQTGTRDINLLGGLAKQMPLSAALAGIAAVSMAGVPPLAGFISKELFYEATLQTGFSGLFAGLLPVLAVGASIFTFVYSALLFIHVFFGRQRGTTPQTPQEASGLMLLGPAVLGLITVTVGLFPDFFGRLLINPAVAVLGRGSEMHYSLWHGLTPALMMSLVTIGIGVVLYISVDKLRIWFKSIQTKINPNYFYDRGLELLISGSTRLTNWYMTGFLRDYVVYIIGAFIVIVGSTFLLKVDSIVGWSFGAVNLYEVILALLFVTAIITIVRTSSRIVGVLALGVVGFVVSTFWVIFRAPDLALTQLIVESISLILYLLVFQRLPRFIKDIEARGKKIVDVVVATGFGLTIAGLALAAHGTRLYKPISDYYIANSLDLAGGTNVVNVTLVDFRGLDTMGEITVLSIAAMSVYALIKLRKKDAK